MLLLQLRRSLCKVVSFNKPLFNLYSSAKTTPASDKDDIDFRKPHTAVLFGDTVVCWHPDPEFPYEHSRPIDLKALKKAEGVVFSSQILESDKLRPKKGPSNSELREIFYTVPQQFVLRPREDRLYGVSAPIPKRK
uniref:39S ribosomal protein L42, mitochondrial n=1 Tax=Syphacia muris TaxID=451379 RepID=A0A0N5AQZ3_9BILA